MRRGWGREGQERGARQGGVGGARAFRILLVNIVLAGSEAQLVQDPLQVEFPQTIVGVVQEQWGPILAAL